MLHDCNRCYEEATIGEAMEKSVHALRVDDIDGNVPVEPD